MEPSEFEFLIPVSAKREKTNKGRYYHIAMVTEAFIEEMKSAEDRYILHKEEHFDPTDRTDRIEMEKSQQIRKEIHEHWKMLNPSDPVMRSAYPPK